MNTTSTEPLRTGAEQVRWDLADLYPDRQAAESTLQDIRALSESFADRYQGKVSSLDGPAFADALRKWEALLEQIERVYSYSYLNWCTKTDSSERGAFLQSVREACSQIEQTILFFELEWTQLEDEEAERILNSSSVTHFRHYLEFQRSRKPHLLSEAEEKILVEKDVTGQQAWSRFFDETLGSSRFLFDGQQLTEQEVLTKLYEADRGTREQAALSFTDGLHRRLRELTYVFNMTLAEKASQDRLRRYPHWLSSRNLANKISAETVEALLKSVTGRYDLVARYYRLKGELLQLEELFDYDRYAPLPGSTAFYSWDQAKDLVLLAYGSFHPEMESIARTFFEKPWIHGVPQPGKVAGAFSHATAPDVHPYLLLNYSGTARDVQTLAHEMGHGVHQYLSRRQGALQAHTPLTMAETASVFGEMLVFDQLMTNEKDPRARLSMLAGKIDDTVATVFRQVAMTCFEDQIHQIRRSRGELSADQFSDIWMETQSAMFQGTVRLSEHYRVWWSYIPHFIHTPGYVYAYAFGELMVLALYTQYRKKGQAFAEEYLRLLEAGDSNWPHVVLGNLGVDLDDPDFWLQGLSAIEGLIEQAEEIAGKEA